MLPKTLCSFLKRIVPFDKCHNIFSFHFHLIYSDRLQQGIGRQFIKKNPDRFLGFGSVTLGLSIEETQEWIETQIGGSYWIDVINIRKKT